MSCGVLIPSCDRYNLAWGVLRHSFRKYWPGLSYLGNLGYRTYCISNGLDSPFDETLKVVDDSWSGCVLDALEMVPEEVIILFLDDYWFLELADSVLISKAVDFVSCGGGLQVRVTPSEEVEPFNDWLNHIRDDAFYIASAQIGVWSKDYLKTFLVRGESIWDFEDRGSKRRTSCLNFSLKVPAVKVFSQAIIRKGKWTGDAIDYCNRENLPFNVNFHPIDTK